ncbi:MAG: cysteine hydrolase family protein [Geminicoccales bacterium]
MNQPTVEHPKRDRLLGPKETAVLVVDAQMSEYNAAKRIEQPNYVETIETQALPAIKHLIRSARPMGVEIVYTMIESLTQCGRDRSLDHKLSGIHVPKGSPDAQIIPGIEPDDDDIVLPKTSSGVFNSTNIDYVLRNLGIKNVIVVGFLTDQCVDMAVRDGADRGYYMICASDGCATYSVERHNLALKAFGGYCRVQTVDQVLTTLAISP